MPVVSRLIGGMSLLMPVVSRLMALASRKRGVPIPMDKGEASPDPLRELILQGESS